MNEVHTYSQGTTVKFKGGLGRGEHYGQPGDIHTGIVNGPVRFADGGAYVPVHVREFNRNVIVFSENIVEVVQ